LADESTAQRVLIASFVLSGLRVPRADGIELFRGVRSMRESTTYQYILDEGRAEGRAEGARQLLLQLARKRFGSTDAAMVTAINAITDPERLVRIGERVYEVATWQELLATP
jgi:predicted transposase YdaD